jgi:acetolactate synthase-1/2/3 large subunit
MERKYSDLVADWLVEAGYTTFFYVAGGNIMHLLESFSHKLKGVPVVHEVAAGIAAEYFNEYSKSEKALALVTAGPGLTNIVTAVAGAWLEKRDLLVIGGQVKTADLNRGEVRQRGIQEVDGVEIMRPITLKSTLLEAAVGQSEFLQLISGSGDGVRGPIFLEVPLDVQARQLEEGCVNSHSPSPASLSAHIPTITQAELNRIVETIRNSERPVILLGGGLNRALAQELSSLLESRRIPTMTTYNGCDRFGSDSPLYFGRPNTWGMRYSNLLIQQADLVIALGTRLGMQQTGFNWQEFVPLGTLIQVDCDQRELTKGHPKVDWPICGDANQVFLHLANSDLGAHEAWIDYCNEVKRLIPISETANCTGEGYISPYDFNLTLSSLCASDDFIVPCSSGGAFTCTFQSFMPKMGQTMASDKSLASMGYGLSAAIGAAFTDLGRRTILIEGDGGFAQNLQELGTVAINNLNIKMFVFDDSGYASIRMTQSNYFGGNYVGCDRTTGLGLPQWEKIFSAWNVPVTRLTKDFATSPEFLASFNTSGPRGYLVPVDPKQTYFPKISSRVTSSGSMESNPLHLMSPELSPELYRKVGRYFA